MAMTLARYAAEFPVASAGVAEVLSGTSLFLSQFRVKPIKGLIEKYGECSYQGGVSTRSINNPFPATAQSVVSPKEERVMIAGTQCKTDVRLANATDNKARGNEIARRTQVVSRYIDYQIIRGEGTTNQEKIVGFNDRLSGSQLINVTDIPSALGGMRLIAFEALIDSVEDQGAGRIVVMNRKCFRTFKRSLTAGATGSTIAEISSEHFSYEGVKVLVAGKDHDGNELLPFNEDNGDGATTSSAYCFAPGTDVDETGVQLLMATNSIEVIPEGIRDSQYIDALEVAVGLAIYHPKAAARIKGLDAN